MRTKWCRRCNIGSHQGSELKLKQPASSASMNRRAIAKTIFRPQKFSRNSCALDVELTSRANVNRNPSSFVRAGLSPSPEPEACKSLQEVVKASRAGCRSKSSQPGIHVKLRGFAENHCTREHDANKVPEFSPYLGGSFVFRSADRCRNALLAHRQLSLTSEEKLERAKGFEPSTPTLARSCSTPELHPHPLGMAARHAAAGRSYSQKRAGLCNHGRKTWR